MPELTPERAEEILDQIEEAYPELLLLENLSSLRIEVIDEGQMALVVEANANRDEVDAIAQEIVGGNRIPLADAEEEGTAVSVHVRTGGPYRAQARPGDTAFGAGLQGFGTAGWNVVLDNRVVCLSNWHVLCPDGNNTPLRHRVFLAGQDVAELVAFKPIVSRGINEWDYALAAYDDPGQAAGVMRACADASVRPYPQALSRTVDLGDRDETYWKVGARTPVCRSGRLTGYGGARVEFNDNSFLWFRNQLFFSKMSDGGDSGAVITRGSDNTVTGLNFAGGPESTIANPLYRLTWGKVGQMSFDTGPTLPVFEEFPRLPLAAGDGLLEAYVEEGSAGAALKAAASVPEQRDIPGLSSGLVYVGAGWARVTQTRSPVDLRSNAVQPAWERDFKRQMKRWGWKYSWSKGPTPAVKGTEVFVAPVSLTSEPRARNYSGPAKLILYCLFFARAAD